MMLESLLKYTAIADRKVIEIFSKYTCEDRTILLFSHILNAQHIWAHRIFHAVPQYERMQVHAPGQFMAISEKNTEDLQFIVDTLPLDQQIQYANSDGSRYENTIGDILHHVVNHSTHHRGQVIAQLKSGGLEVPVTDFIFFKRNGEL